MKVLSKLLMLLMILSSSLAFAADPVKDEKKAPAPAAEYKYKTPKLNRAQFDALLAHPEQLTIIDVRRPDELTKNGGFPVYLSIQAADVEKNLAFIPKIEILSPYQIMPAGQVLRPTC